MKKSALSALILSCLFKVAVCEWTTFLTLSKSWEEARNICRAHDSDLVSISNQKEDEDLRSKMPDIETYEIWIGLYKDDDGVWKWPGGRNASFFNWSKNEHSVDRRCASRNKNGWQKKTCREKLHFVCFKSKLVLVKEKKTWEEAMEQCDTQHGHLVSLTSRTAVSQTLRTITDAKIDRVWTGMRYLADNWLWVNGDKVEYQAWSTGDPPQCPAWTHHCGAFSLEKHLESWDCADKLNFVCFEKEDL